jgi:hypothetical protein
LAKFDTWNCPLPNGGVQEEMALVFERPSPARLLVLPAWFDEANKLRRQTVEVMRRLALSGIASVLPDLPGCNDSLAPLTEQTLPGWREAAAAAARHFRATHLLSFRAGALIAPEELPGWRYAPIGGRQVLRAMLRARTVASKEAGHPETTEALAELGRREGIELAGWPLGATMFTELEVAEVPAEGGLAQIEQADLGGGSLWLRAEPDEDPEQADALAAIVAIGLARE